MTYCRSHSKVVDGKLVTTCYDESDNEIPCPPKENKILGAATIMSGSGDWRDKLPGAYKEGLKRFKGRHLAGNTIPDLTSGRGPI